MTDVTDLIGGRCLRCGRVRGKDTGQPPYRCRCAPEPGESALSIAEFWDVLAARGGRLLAEYTGCESTGHYSAEIFRFDHASGGRSYFCRPCWTDAWLAAGKPPQELLAALSGGTPEPTDG